MQEGRKGHRSVLILSNNESLSPSHRCTTMKRTSEQRCDAGRKKWTETSFTKRTIFIQMKQGCAAMKKRMWVDYTDPDVRGWPSQSTNSYTLRYLVRPHIEPSMSVEQQLLEHHVLNNDY